MTGFFVVREKNLFVGSVRKLFVNSVRKGEKIKSNLGLAALKSAKESLIDKICSTISKEDIKFALSA